MPKGLTPHEIHAYEQAGRVPFCIYIRTEVSSKLHFCKEWDFMLIDETDPEFEALSL